MDKCEHVLNVETYAREATTTNILKLEQNIYQSDSNYSKINAVFDNQEENAGNMGQTESKKYASKRCNKGDSATTQSIYKVDLVGASAVKTKGTATSFGFLKKFNTTKTLKSANESDLKKKPLHDKTKKNQFPNTELNLTTSDANGNTGTTTVVNFERVSKESCLTSKTASEQQNIEYHRQEAKRFGYRGYTISQLNAASPASTLVQNQKKKENILNKNYECTTDADQLNTDGLINNWKVRSKAEPSGPVSIMTADYNNKNVKNQTVNNKTTGSKLPQPKSITFNLNQNSTNEYERNFLEESVNNECFSMSDATDSNANGGIIPTNVIVKITPREQPKPTFSKFTLQTVNLPKAEFAVPISVNCSTPITPGSSNFHVGTQADTLQHHPLTAVHMHPGYMDVKTTKQCTNNTCRTFAGSREVSADSGIVSMDSTLETASPNICRSRARNLEMVMNGRHKFEVRDQVQSLSPSSRILTPLTLPKLPLNDKSAILPLNGLVRGKTILYNENCDRKIQDGMQLKLEKKKAIRNKFFKSSLDETNSCNEVKNISRTKSSQGSANVVDSSAVSNCSNTNKLTVKEPRQNTSTKLDINVETKYTGKHYMKTNMKSEQPQVHVNETKFAEMAFAGCRILLDDETSPTDSLFDSSDSVGTTYKQKKHKTNTEMQEENIDEISLELQLGSSSSTGTPTQASHSLSFSDCGNLIDDEIVDQPALLFNNDVPTHVDEDLDTDDDGDSTSMHGEKTDTPTLMETMSYNRQSKSVLHQDTEANLHTPSKAILDRAESIDTLSLCPTPCSNDLIMDFEISSSADSIDSKVMPSCSDSNKLEEKNIYTQLNVQTRNLLKNCSNLTRSRQNRTLDHENIISRLPRLLNRSRLQCIDNIHAKCSEQSSVFNSDISRSLYHVRCQGHSAESNLVPTNSAALYIQGDQQLHKQLPQSRENHTSQSSLDDLMLYDKSFKNSMIQDVSQFKNQLFQLRSYLEEMEITNPFKSLDSHADSDGCKDKTFNDLAWDSLNSAASVDPLKEIFDLRRQVDYLESQVQDRERTIRLQQNRINKLETVQLMSQTQPQDCHSKATQTERTRNYRTSSDDLYRSAHYRGYLHIGKTASRRSSEYYIKKTLVTDT